MSLTTHHRAVRTTPCYGPSHTVMRKCDAAGFPRAFRRARTARAFDNAIEPHAPSRSSHSAPWTVAFAILLVTNYGAYATASLPRGYRDRFEPALTPDGHHDAQAASIPGEVVAEPLPQVQVKSEYTPVDVLRAVAAARTPFASTGESMTDVYSLMTGRDIPHETRETVKAWGTAIDITSGLIPEVQMLRLPAEVSDMAVDSIDGKPPTIDRIIGLTQFASPRGSGSPAAPEPAPPRLAAKSGVRRPPKSPLWLAPKDERIGVVDLQDNLAAEKPTSRFAIRGEFDHLDGYEQTFTQAELPTDKATRLALVGGHRYLRGEAGYYRISQGLSGDHWLIDAPRQTRAQVPVTYDPVTDQWRAHEPLRVCGGGCGPSRPISPDSIATSFDSIFSATMHVTDEGAQEAIHNAFADLSRLHLVRSNRPDLRMLRDNSIIDHRAALRVAMRDIDPQLPLVKQQGLVAEATARYYYSHPFAEAFCQENAEILYHFLLQDGVSSDQLRMITVQPKNRSPHVMVLFTESHRFIDMLDASTPRLRESLRLDGLSSGQFAWAAYMTRDTTLLLDPWSRNKAISFVWANEPQDVVDILDVAFADIGHRTGSPYTVSLTRPLASRRSSPGSQSSLGSPGSSGASSGTSRSSLLSSSSPRLSASVRPAAGQRRASAQWDIEPPGSESSDPVSQAD
ncbi:hypothetical protein [Pandoraea commovens]|uniref:Uncharacterized protein n=1 Tax=Pandoraea commovens TaxID=2508289 RepID=A0ABY5QH96_9BURK|nr:hypothetical protein [Pandoraea commovens]UVA79890.1 hypothetical protein NTU39_02310 [Pandoraea commovens]